MSIWNVNIKCDEVSNNVIRDQHDIVWHHHGCYIDQFIIWDTGCHGVVTMFTMMWRKSWQLRTWDTCHSVAIVEGWYDVRPVRIAPVLLKKRMLSLWERGPNFRPRGWENYCGTKAFLFADKKICFIVFSWLWDQILVHTDWRVFIKDWPWVSCRESSPPRSWERTGQSKRGCTGPATGRPGGSSPAHSCHEDDQSLWWSWLQRMSWKTYKFTVLDRVTFLIFDISA